MQRRRFIKTFTIATAYSSLLGNSWTDLVAAEFAPLATSNTGTLRLNLQDFPVLQSASGSVRLAINPLQGGPPSGPMPQGIFYPIIINRGSSNDFYALNSRCTHQSCVVEAMDASNNRMTCLCHGSMFGIDGRRISGLATAALARYTIAFNGTDRLEIQVPNLRYTVTLSNVQNAKLKLIFAALRNVSYEVRFRETLDQDAQVVPFSRTADGVADQTAFTPTSNTTANLFVEHTSSTGFYTVAVVLTEV